MTKTQWEIGDTILVIRNHPTRNMDGSFEAVITNITETSAIMGNHCRMNLETRCVTIGVSEIGRGWKSLSEYDQSRKLDDAWEYLLKKLVKSRKRPKHITNKHLTLLKSIINDTYEPT